MKTKSINKWKNCAVRCCAVAMAACVIAGVAVLSGTEAASGKTSVAAVSTGLTDVTGQYDTSALRNQYLNSDAVSLNPTDMNAERWVVVELADDSISDAYAKSIGYATLADYANTTSAQSKREKLERKQENFLRDLKASGISYEYKYSYTALINGVAIKVKYKDISSIGAMPNVTGVHISESYAAPTVAVSNNANVYSTGIYNSQGIEYQGEGMVIAVLDTGLDYTHAAFLNMPGEEAQNAEGYWTKEYVENLFGDTEAYGRGTSVTADDVYVNAKVPYAYDYADDDANVYPSYSNHGTHVAGIVAGKDDSKIVNSDTGETFIGVAPEAQLMICKVFTDNLDSDLIGNAEGVDILAAVSDCVTMGVDVINMSLGTSCGFTDEGYYDADGEYVQNAEGDYVINTIYEKVEEAGISLVTAASNDYSSGYGGAYGTNLTSNPDSGTVGSPSSYSAALSVASINGQESDYFSINGNSDDVAFITESVDANANTYEFLELIYQAAIEKGIVSSTSEDLTLDYVVVGGVGRASNYTTSVKRALSTGNTIAVVKRGDINFSEKVQNAMANGAIACIIYNNLSGTIRMNLGDIENPIPTCSISMDAGALLVNGATNGKGTVTFSYSQSAGPFMSDFSSWGPTPDLKLKPEITAHGGEITSAIPGGYGVFSGTSMAAPNMSGAITLLRQHVLKTTGLTGAALNARVYQLLMSTATMARNEEGNPYSPRKQGAGLAGIADAINTAGYLTVENEDGKESAKTKIELGDDPEKTGIYEFDFTLHNQSDETISYKPSVYVMTESLSTDLKTVAEKAYMLTDDCTISFTAGGFAADTVTVGANDSVKVHVKITLGEASRQYLDDTFENGMYVEGFVRLVPEGSGDGAVELGLPYLAFYGDWTAAPLLDYSLYEVEESAAQYPDDPELQLQASSNATRALGAYWDGKYIINLGAYLYSMDDGYTEILPSAERAAISCFDLESKRTVYEFYMIYAGLLRGAKTMTVVITDDTTGEVVYREEKSNVRKSYAGGGSNAGSPVRIGINPADWGMSNNSTYSVSLQGTLDYDYDRETTVLSRDTFSFSFTVDTEAPIIKDYRIRYEPYTENKETKYRIYIDADVYDNQYAMTLLPCYLKDKVGEDGQELALLVKNPIPIYSQKGSTTTVSFEVTDMYDEYVKTGKLYLVVSDYALNDSMYLVSAVDHTEYPESVSLTTDDKLVYDSTASGGYGIYSLTLGQYESYKVLLTALPDTTFGASLSYYSNGSVYVEENEIYTTSKDGRGTVTLMDGYGTTLALINVTVTESENKTPSIEKITLNPVLDADGTLVTLDGGAITLHANTQTTFVANVEPWYAALSQDVVFEWSSDNDNVLTVDQDGVVSTRAKGTAYVTVKVKGNTLLSKIVRVTVDDEFDVESGYLYHYYGGKDVVIPESKNVTTVAEDCFRYNTLIETVTIPSTLTSIPEKAFVGCVNLKKVIISGECITIGTSAFEGCTSLEEIVLLPLIEKKTGIYTTGTITLGNRAFYGCTALRSIVTDPDNLRNLEEGETESRITTLGSYTFYGCTSLTSVDLRNLRVTGREVFRNCSALSEVQMSSLTALGQGMFYNCDALVSVGLYTDGVPAYLFYGCDNLEEVSFLASSLTGIGDYAFYGCKKLAEVTLPDGSYAIGDNAFAGCTVLASVALSSNTKLDFGAVSPFKNNKAFTAYTLPEGSAYYAVTDGILFSQDGSTLVSVPAGKAFDESGYEIPSGVDTIASGAFAGSQILSVSLGNINLGTYAFAGSSIKSVDLGNNRTVIPEGTFSQCTALKSVAGLKNVTEVGAYAFYGCYGWTDTVDLGKATTIGDYAFSRAGIAGIEENNSIETIGNYAFYDAAASKSDPITGFTSDVVLSAVKEIGDYAFASQSNKNFTSGKVFSSITLGPVQKMGIHVFADCTYLKTVVFGEGTTVIGAWAFVSDSVHDYTYLGTTTRTEGAILTDVENKTIVNVTIPATVTEIGDYAFYHCTALSSANIDASAWETVGTAAFYMAEKVTGLDLRAVKRAYGYAFAGTALTTAELDSAEEIGAYAFSQTALKTVSIPSAKYLGPFAFAFTSLATVEIPATMNAYSYDSAWERTTDDNQMEAVDGGMMIDVYGAGAFAGIPTLTGITVASGNPVFFSEDGVLYAKTQNGYVLLQYPAGKAGTEYTPVEGTIRIGDAAFYWSLTGGSALQSVCIPYSVKMIGSYAFYLCPATTYTFEGVEAPILEAVYDENVYNYGDLTSTDNAFYRGLFYSNFYYYAAEVTYNNRDFGLTAYYPENGTGYDSQGYLAFFSNVVYMEYAADSTTKNAVAAIEALDSLDAIKATVEECATDTEKLAYLNELSANGVRSARLLYNQITAEEQFAFAEEAYEKLLGIEAYIRSEKGLLGEPVALSELVIVSSPVKYRYVPGEAFDPTGLSIKVVYEDLSEVVLESGEYTLSVAEGEALPALDPTEVTVSYEGLSKSFLISVSQNNAEVVDPEPPVEEEGLSAGAIAGIAVAAVVVVAGAAAVAVVMILRGKKRSAAQSDASEESAEEKDESDKD